MELQRPPQHQAAPLIPTTKLVDQVMKQKSPLNKIYKSRYNCKN